MQMTEAEIVKSYQRAEKKREQIKILAELNACQKQVIRDILEKNGEEAPKTGNRYTAAKPEGLKEEKPKLKGSRAEAKNTDGAKETEKRKDAVKTPKAVIELAVRRAQELKDLIDGIQESIRDLREEQDLRRKELAELETWIKEQEGRHGTDDR